MKAMFISTKERKNIVNAQSALKIVEKGLFIIKLLQNRKKTRAEHPDYHGHRDHTVS